MEINQKKDTIQNEALKAWIDNDKIGTTEIITGMGKTFLFFKALRTFPKYENDTLHLFLAEQKDRLGDFTKDMIKFNNIYNCNIMAEYNVQFQCYQTVRNWSGYKLGLVGADEIHDSISPENAKFYFNNAFQGILGLTAKFDGSKYYDFSNNKQMTQAFGKIMVSKQEMLDMIAPIVYSYNINQGQEDNTSRKLNIFVFNHYLESKEKTIKAGNRLNPFYQTEAAAYNYLTKKFTDALNLQPYQNEHYAVFEDRKNLEIIKVVNKRTTFLHNLKSRLDLVKLLLKYINTKTIVFGNSITELDKITPNVVSSKKTDAENESIRALFDRGIIDVIASFKKLKQGANLEKVANCVMHSYYSTEIDFIQRIGRLRQDEDKEGNVFIFVATGTQEEVWLNKMLENADNFNIIRMTLDTFISEKHYENL